MTPEFLYFDLGNVLVHFDHEIALQQLSTVSACPVDRIREALFDSDWPVEYERGAIETTEFYRRLREATGIETADDVLGTILSNIFQVNHAIVPLIGSLRQSGIPMGLLSNTCEIHWQFLTSWPYAILDMFPVKALSFRLGAVKPEPGIWTLACELAGTSPERIFFTDDQAANIDGALSAGLDAVLFKSVEDLRWQLEQRHVPFNC